MRVTWLVYFYYCLVCCCAWAVPLPGPIHRILIHHVTLSQSRNGCSMSLAKSILSQNVRRVRVCKRHFLPARNRKARNGEISVSWRIN